MRQQILTRIEKKKLLLDAKRPLPKALSTNLEDRTRIDLTYHSNAIEGNTLTRQETALVVDEGLSINGKTVNEILEARGHDHALTLILEWAKTKKKLTEEDICTIHATLLSAIDPANAGTYRQVSVRTKWSQTIFPNYIKIPQLMKKLETRFHTTPDNPLMVACDLHYEFVSIHPFTDGNGRTARLLFNFALLKNGYPLTVIHKEERKAYLTSLEKAQTWWKKDDYYTLMLSAIERTVDIWLDSLNSLPEKSEKTQITFLKIGQVAKHSGESIPTIRHRTEFGLLPVAARTDKWYALYDESVLNTITQIRQLQSNQRLTLEEIKKILNT